MAMVEGDAGPPVMTSAAGLLALLEEEHEQLKEHALKTLIDVVDHHWAEVAGCISVCEALYEDEDFGPRKYAALLASKVGGPLPVLSRRVLRAGQSAAWHAYALRRMDGDSATDGERDHTPRGRGWS
jgi:hypothetical protein